MNILQVFGAVIYLSHVSSYVLNRFDNGHQVISGFINVPGSDHSYVTKVHRKRYTGYGQKSLMREANDLLNSYFKLGSYPRSDFVVPSPERSPERAPERAPERPPDVFVENVSPKLASSIQPTAMTKKVKKVQMEIGDRSHQMPFELQTPRPVFVMDKVEPSNKLEMEQKVVKRPIIVVGRVRMGAGGASRLHEGWRKRRNMALRY